MGSVKLIQLVRDALSVATTPLPEDRQKVIKATEAIDEIEKQFERWRNDIVKYRHALNRIAWPLQYPQEDDRTPKDIALEAVRIGK
jgi:hypothetical protein